MHMAPDRIRSRLKPGRVTQGDPALIKACLEGKQASWDELVNRYGRLVYSIPRRFGFSDADSDDVVQNVFAILFGNLDSVRDRDRLPAWLIRTTHRECYRIGKQAGRYSELEAVIEDVGSPPEDRVLTWERQQLVRQALRRLGGLCEQLLTALFLAGGRPSYETIADQLGMKVGSVGPTRTRCFAKLERILVSMGLSVDPAIGVGADE